MVSQNILTVSEIFDFFYFLKIVSKIFIILYFGEFLDFRNRKKTQNVCLELLFHLMSTATRLIHICKVFKNKK